VAREELEAIRLMPLFPGPNIQVYEGHEWEPVAGKSLLFRELGDAAPRGGMAAPELTYPDHYRGIETRVGILPPPIQDQDSMDYQNTRIVRLEVRWKMAGQAEEAGARGTQVYHVTVSRRPS